MNNTGSSSANWGAASGSNNRNRYAQNGGGGSSSNSPASHILDDQAASLLESQNDESVNNLHAKIRAIKGMHLVWPGSDHGTVASRFEILARGAHLREKTPDSGFGHVYMRVLILHVEGEKAHD
ncbi:hypothetical protein HDU98_010459 [Podochytrium sp. JEL0797]|nr:hypothetical protein HDU98_010459 [Podochytrium sp. JEL0797]